MANKKFIPTPEQREQVKAMVGYGIKYDAIAAVVKNPHTGKGISKHTLINSFPDELAEGASIANAAVAQSLFNKATGRGVGAVTAAIWWEKTRTGMKEVSKLEVGGPNGGPVHIDLRYEDKDL